MPLAAVWAAAVQSGIRPRGDGRELDRLAPLCTVFSCPVARLREMGAAKSSNEDRGVSERRWLIQIAFACSEPLADGGWPRIRSSYGYQRRCHLPKVQSTSGDSEFIIEASNSSKFAKRNSCPAEPTSPLSAKIASAVRSLSRASRMASKQLAKFACRSSR